LGVHDKIEQYYRLVDKFNLLPENILYMGDDIPDFPVMELVGFPCAPQDAAPEIKGVSKYISPKKGGEGCVRDVIEQIMRVQGKWKGKFYAKYD
jgi:3-deoxy-D-manno-octulosonate 8-phosphate phosphatase (KDO 8-P phosphatase)